MSNDCFDIKVDEAKELSRGLPKESMFDGECFYGFDIEKTGPKVDKYFSNLKPYSPDNEFKLYDFEHLHVYNVKLDKWDLLKIDGFEVPKMPASHRNSKPKYMGIELNSHCWHGNQHFCILNIDFPQCQEDHQLLLTFNTKELKWQQIKKLNCDGIIFQISVDHSGNLLTHGEYYEGKTTCMEVHQYSLEGLIEL